MKIGYRTIKTAVGTAISIFLAQQLGLEYYASAGIITILCIQVTRRRSFETALHRIFACVIGILLGAVLFLALGYQPVAILLWTLVFIPLCVRFRIVDGFVTSTVVLLHLYSAGRIDLAIVGNELALLGIGVGVALVVNLYMPNIERELKNMQRDVEYNFSVILQEFCYYLRHGQSAWGGKEMIETAALLEQAIDLAVRDVENRLGRQEDNHYYQYFLMRQKQFELLERMLPIVSSLHLQVPQGHQIADFLEHLSQSIHSGNTAHLFLYKLRAMREAIQQTPLPQTREEFETRASLFYLLREIEEYLYIKHRLGKKDKEKAAARG